MKILKKLLMVVLSLALVLSSGVTIVAEDEVLQGPPVSESNIRVIKTAHEHKEGESYGAETNYFYRLNGEDVVVDYVIEVVNPFWYPIYNVTISDSLNNETRTVDKIEGKRSYKWKYELTFNNESNPDITNYARVEAYSLDPDAPAAGVEGIDYKPGKPIPTIPDETYNVVVDNTIHILNMGLTFTKVIVDEDDQPVTNPNFDLFDEVTFLFTITNTGVTPITDLEFKDPQLGIDHYRSLKNFGELVEKPEGYGNSRTLQPGERYIFKMTKEVGWRDLDFSNNNDLTSTEDIYLTSKENEAFIKAEGEREVVVLPLPVEGMANSYSCDCGSLGNIDIALEAKAGYTLNEPGIEIEKTLISHEPDLFNSLYFNDDEAYFMTYRLTVTNVGRMDFGEVLVTDKMEQHFDSYGENYEEVIMEDLLAGDQRIYEYSVEIPAGVVGLQENCAEAVAYLNEVPVEDQRVSNYSDSIEYCPRPWDPLAYDDDEMSIYLIDDPAFDITVEKTAGRWEPIDGDKALTENNVQNIEEISYVSLPSFEFVEADGEPPVYKEFEWVVYRFEVENTGETGGLVYLDDSMLFGDHPKFLGWLEAGESRTYYARPISFDRWRNPELLEAEEPAQRGLVENEVTARLLTYEWMMKPQQVFVGAALTSPELCPPIEEAYEGAKATDAELIKVAIPKVTVEKTTAKEDYAVGEDVIYNFRVTNEGSVNLETVYFSDYLLSENAYVIDWSDVGPLGIGEDYQTSLTSTYAVEGRYFNTAFAWGYIETTDLTDFFNKDEVQEDEGGTVAPEAVMECSDYVWPDAQAFDMHEVDVWEVGIMLDKTADKATYRTGETVTYTFTITNVGIRDLWNIHLVDPQLELDEYLGNLAFSELEEEEVLEPIVFTKTWVYNSPGTVTNTATATGGFYTYDELDVIIGEGLSRSDGLPEVGLPAPPEGSISDTDSVTITITSPPTTNTTPRTTTTTTVVEEEVIPEAIPEPVSLVFVVTGEGNIRSSSIDFDDVGETYTFGPLEGDPGWTLTYVGGPDSADLVMIDETTFFIEMDSDKEIHITFEEALTDVLDEVTPEAGEFDIEDEDLPKTGGLPLAVPMALGTMLTGLGLGLKKKRH